MLGVQPLHEMQPYTQKATFPCAMLKTLRLKAAFQRLDFDDFWSKRGNRPTSETQPQKKRDNLKPKRVLLEGGSKKE